MLKQNHRKPSTKQEIMLYIRVSVIIGGAGENSAYPAVNRYNS